MNNLFFSLSQQLRKINMQIICICSIVGCSLASLYYLYYIFNNDLKFEDFWGFLYLLADIILVVALVLIAVFIGLKKQSVFFLIPFLLLILQEVICLFIFVINNIYLGNIYSILYVLCTIFMHLVFVGACIVTIIFIIYPIVETFRFIIIAIMPYTNLNLLSILYYLISYVIAAAIILALVYIEIKPYEPPVQNGFIQKNGPMPYNGQMPYQNQGPMPYQGPMNIQGQVPNQGPYPNNGQVPPQNQGYNQGQAPNQAQGPDQNLNNNQPNG